MDSNTMYERSILRVKTKKQKLTLKSIFSNFILFLYALIVVIPILWLLKKAFFNYEIIRYGGFYLFNIFDYMKFIWTNYEVYNFLINSLIITAPTVFITILICSMGAFAINILRWKYRERVRLYFLIGITIPVQIVIIPLYIYYTNWDLLNSKIGLLVPTLAIALPYSIYVLSNHYKNFSIEVIEASLLDGCSMFRSFVSIIFPMTKPGLMTLGMFLFINTWNDLLLPMTLVNDVTVMTFPVAILNLIRTGDAGISKLFIILLISIIPTFWVYLIINKKIAKDTYLEYAE